MRFIEQVEHPQTLESYAAVAHLATAVELLRTAAAPVAERFRGRTIWMVNSTASGGGVAEMLPGMIALLRDLGLRAAWAVIETDEPRFFELTKHIHNLLHGEGSPSLSAADAELYEAVNRTNVGALAARLRDGDVVIVHDPQPMPLAVMLRAHVDVAAVWRCHIGVDETNDATEAAWEFLAPYAAAYQRAIFSAAEYVPALFRDRAAVIHPGIDPLASKNRDMHVHEIVRVLSNAQLVAITGPALRPPFEHTAQRLQSNGTFQPATRPEDFGLLVRPIVTQVSRWDRLKGFAPLLAAFAQLKRSLPGRAQLAPLHRRRLELVRLVLAGPEAAGVTDDPEGARVLDELCTQYLALEPAMQADIALITLPMHAPLENALMVNALQRVSSIIVQNSLREGFGLTITEALWKRIPVLSNSHACGARVQVRDDYDGRLIHDPENSDELCDALVDMLSAADRADRWGQNGQHHVHARFLVFSQLRHLLEVLNTV